MIICLHTEVVTSITIYLNMVKWFNIQTIDRTQSGATTLGQSGPGSNGNEGAFHFLQRIGWFCVIRSPSQMG